MPRVVWLTMVAAALLAGFLVGVAVMRTPVSAANEMPPPAAAGLTTFERGQLEVGCFQASATAFTGAGNSALVFSMNNILRQCLDRVEKMP